MLDRQKLETILLRRFPGATRAADCCVSQRDHGARRGVGGRAVPGFPGAGRPARRRRRVPDPPAAAALSGSPWRLESRQKRPRQRPMGLSRNLWGIIPAWRSLGPAGPTNSRKLPGIRHLPVARRLP